MERSDVVEILDQYMDALNTGDCSAVRFSDDVRFFGPMQDDPIEGKEAVIEFIAAVREGFRNVRTIRHVVEGSTACSLIEFETNDGTILPVVDYFEVGEAGISFIRPYFDPRPVIDN